MSATNLTCFQRSDFVGIDVTEQPHIGVSPVVPFEHFVSPIIDIIGKLTGIPDPDKFRDAGGIILVETDNSRFNHDEPGSRYPEVRHTRRPPGERLHDNPVTVVRLDVQYHVKILAHPELHEGFVPDNDLFYTGCVMINKTMPQCGKCQLRELIRIWLVWEVLTKSESQDQDYWLWPAFQTKPTCFISHQLR